MGSLDGLGGRPLSDCIGGPECATNLILQYLGWCKQYASTTSSEIRGSYKVASLTVTPTTTEASYDNGDITNTWLHFSKL